MEFESKFLLYGALGNIYLTSEFALNGAGKQIVSVILTMIT